MTLPPDHPGEAGDAAGHLYDYAASGTFPRRNVRLLSPLIIETEGLFPAHYVKDGRNLLREIGDEFRVGKVILFAIEPLWKCRIILNSRFPDWGLPEHQHQNWRAK